MPTPRSRAACTYLMEHNKYYAEYVKQQGERLESGPHRHISSYDLFIMYRGVEAAIWPVLYPCTEMCDTGILAHHKAEVGDEQNRVVSMGHAFTRKALSNVRVYGEQRDLCFFLYEKHLANIFRRPRPRPAHERHRGRHGARFPGRRWVLGDREGRARGLSADYDRPLLRLRAAP